MNANGFVNGNTINSIGFTLGAAQKDTTKGAFKVYLQNTTDTVSRVDTSWTVVTSPAASLGIAGLFAGNYEWQVKSVCAGNSPYSALTNFSNDNVGSCSQPTNLATSNITTTTATFNWDAPSSTLTKYYIEYKSSDSVNWIKDSTTNVSYNALSLLPGKTYQWHVKTSCSSASSDFIATSFMTNGTISCNAPTALTVGAVADSSAQISWTAVPGASYYAVIYRRAGTANWGSTLAFTKFTDHYIQFSTGHHL